MIKLHTHSDDFFVLMSTIYYIIGFILKNIYKIDKINPLLDLQFTLH